jgi:hypothetical protein
VVMAVAPTANQIVLIYRKMPLTQLLNMVTNGFDFSNLNVVHDRIVAMLQVVNEVVNRCPQLALASQVTQPNYIPEPPSGYALGWNLGAWVWYAVGSVNGAIATLTGDVTSPGGANAVTTIAPNAVTNAKMAQMAASTMKGNNTAGLANVMDLTVAQVQALLFALDSPSLLQNIGFSTAVGSSQLTANVLTKALTAPSATSPVNVAFRDATSATGDYIVRQLTAALSLVVPSGATLGTSNGNQAFLYWYLIDNAGTLALGVCGQKLDEKSVQSSTAISSGSNSGSILYSLSSLSNKAVRFIARTSVTEATAGTWATNASEISIGNIETPTQFFMSPQYNSSSGGGGDFTLASVYPTFADWSVPIIITFTPLVTGIYKVWVNAPTELETAGHSGYYQIINTAGSAVVVDNSAMNIDSPVGIWPMLIFGFFQLNAGTQYTFNMRSCSDSGVAQDLRCDITPMRMYAERVA